MKTNWYEGTCPFCERKYDCGLLMHLGDCYVYGIAHVVNLGHAAIVRIGKQCWYMQKTTYGYDLIPGYDDPIRIETSAAKNHIQEHINSLRLKLKTAEFMLEKLEEQ